MRWKMRGVFIDDRYLMMKVIPNRPLVAPSD